MKVDLSDNALRVLKLRYQKKDSEGTIIETPEEMFRRVALHVAKAERSFGGRQEIENPAEDFYRMLSALEFLPNSPNLMNAVKKDKKFPLVNPRSHTPVKTVRAQEIFDLMVQCAWENGEPGILYLGTKGVRSLIVTFEVGLLSSLKI